MTTITATPVATPDSMSASTVQSSRRARTAAAALGAGIAWVAIGLESIVRPDPQDYRMVLWVVPFLLTTYAVYGMHGMQRHASGVIERIGSVMYVYGAPVIIAGDLALLGGKEMQAFGAVAGVLWTVALVAFGIGTVRAHVFPARVGVLIAASEFLTIAAAGALAPIVPLADKGNFSGVVMHGVAWLVAAAAIRRSRVSFG